MNLTHLKYFIELAETKHYTKAAEHLFITQPSLSHAISQLETELGVPLFEKSGRNTNLTIFGKQFLSCAKNTINTLNNGIESIHLGSIGAGTIRIGMLRFLGVNFIPIIVKKFLTAYPNVDIHFTFGTGVTNTLVSELIDNHYDVIFSSASNINNDFSSIAIAKQTLVLIVPANHPLAQYDSISIENTLNYPYIYYSQNSGLRAVVDKVFDKVQNKLKIAYEIEETEVIAGLVANNFGIAVVPKMSSFKTLNIKQIEITSPIVERNIYMTTKNNHYLPPVVENFCQFIINETSNNIKSVL
ncbi:MAG: LysR substrate-binding domain-containing protein [Lachnospirales bacterium]